MTSDSLFVRFHGRPAEGVPRPIRLAAYATTLVVLPSCLWRLAFGVFDLPISERPAGGSGDGPGGMPGWLYMIVLSLVSEALAFLTVGLVSRWGEEVPRRVPGLGGRRIPVLAAVIPAALGAAALIAISALYFLALEPTPAFRETFPHRWQLGLLYACYAPLLAWGPLLAVVTVAYYRRRTA
ncbi:hypothetical protein [Actinomadura macrotermitis]|uniref:hypothetical protein n=1 Tax=Actinomadura macrotermitis TaxID=2585200 RepID=UPI001295BECC|nr:hypothetical protein [Actinomadura macrotermitis]